jgi:hypothetical protein
MSISNPESQFNYLISDICLRIDFNYDGLSDFINSSLILGITTSEKISKKITKWNKYHPDHKSSGHEIYEGEFIALTNFAHLAITASIILAHSEFENNLKYICKRIGQEQNKKIRLKDINGNGSIDQCKNFLEKVFDLDFSNYKKEWNKIFAFNRLRIILVHQNGEISLIGIKNIQNNLDFKTLSQIKNLTITDLGEVRIKDEAAVKEFIKLSWNMLDSICTQLKE